MSYQCTACSHSALKWAGKCPSCGAWNTLVETELPIKKWAKWGKARDRASITLSTELKERKQLPSSELNAVLGGGIVPGSLILLSGEPGIGKSTLSLQIADWNARSDKKTLYISAEENIHQISDRAHRLGIKNESIELVTTQAAEDLEPTMDASSADLIIIDSISTFSSYDATNAGGMGQIRSIAEFAMIYAKRNKKSIVIIGHVTKDGSISGPKTLEHLVDTVLFLEGSKYENYRILRTLKNRFGPTDEIGLFRMTEKGLIDLPNPGLEFVENTVGVPGSAIGITIEWNRPLIVEIEALTTYTKFGYPKRSSRGIALGKLELLLAVLAKFTDLALDSHDVYLNVARGLSLSEPGIDLAAIAAILSSTRSIIYDKTAFIGEVSLTGSIKNVSGIEKRIAEFVKLGFTRVFIPAKASIPAKLKNSTIKIIPLDRIEELLVHFDGKKR